MAGLCHAARETGSGTGEPARRLGVDEKAARRLPDLRHASKVQLLVWALLAACRGPPVGRRGARRSIQGSQSRSATGRARTLQLPRKIAFAKPANHR